MSDIPSTPGWYPDEKDNKIERWFDGVHWTAYARPLGGNPTPPTALPPIEPQPPSKGNADFPTTASRILPPPPKKRQLSETAKIGLIVVSATVVIMVLVSLWAVTGSKTGKDITDVKTASIDNAPANHVEYQVTGTTKSASVTFQTPSGSSQADVDLPMKTKTGGNLGFTGNPGQYLYISAQNQKSYGTVECTITVDGAVVAHNVADGAYVIATCQRTL